MEQPRKRPPTTSGRAMRLAGMALLTATLWPHLVPDATAQVRWLTVVGGPVVLTIGSAGVIPGTDPLPATHAGTGLEWRTGPSNQKITVSSSAPGQSFTLRVELVDVAGMGTPQPAVLLTDGMFSQDLVRDLNTTPGPATGSATLRYTATAIAEQGNSLDFGIDSHQITFTLTDQ